MEELNCSQSYPVNTEAENYDEPVKFLNEVRVPCLICGADTEIDNIVKQEVDQFDEETANIQEYQLGLEVVSINHEIFYWFLKWFSVDITKNGKKTFIERGWDGEGGDILRFCGSCKMELKVILEVQKQLDELEEKVKNGLLMVKERMERFEEVFQGNGAYDKDQRYKMVRGWILKLETANLDHPTPNQSKIQSSLRNQVYNSSKRRSSRIKTKSNSLEILSNIQASVKSSPMKEVMKVAQKKKIPLTTAKIVRKIVPKKRSSRISVNLHKKISRAKSPRISTKMNVVRSGNETIAPADYQDHEPMDKGSTSNNASAEQHIMRKDPDLNPGVPIDVTVYVKKSTANIAKKNSSRKPVSNFKRTVEEKVCTRNLTRIAKEIVQQNACVREQSTKTTKLRNPRNSKISENHTTAHETTHIENDHESSEDDHESSEDDRESSENDNRDVQRKRKRYNSKYSYELDSSANMITFEGIQFSILKNLHGKVCCTLCNKIFSNVRESIRQHFIKHHSNRYPCSQCSFRGTSKSVLEIHIKAAHQGIPVIKKFPCRICGKPIICARDHEWTHMSKNEQEKVLQMEPGKVPYSLTRNYKCEECGKLIPAQKMRDHKLKYHKHNRYEKPKEKCPQCGKSYASLKYAIKYLHGPARYECMEQGCGKTFRKLASLTQHENCVHKKLKTWKCTKCSRQFTRQGYLTMHMDSH